MQESTFIQPTTHAKLKLIISILCLLLFVLVSSWIGYRLYSLARFNDFMNKYAAYEYEGATASYAGLEKMDRANVIMAKVNYEEAYNYEANHDRLKEAEKLLAASAVGYRANCERPVPTITRGIHLDGEKQEYLNRLAQIEAKTDRLCQRNLSLVVPVSTQTVPAQHWDYNTLLRSVNLLNDQGAQAFADDAEDTLARYKESYFYPNEAMIQKELPAFYETLQATKDILGSLRAAAAFIRQGDYHAALSSLESLEALPQGAQAEKRDNEFERINNELFYMLVDLGGHQLDAAAYFNQHGLEHNVLGGNKGMSPDRAIVSILASGINFYENQHDGKTPEAKTITALVDAIGDKKVSVALQDADTSGVTYKKLGDNGYRISYRDTFDGEAKTRTQTPTN